MMANKNGLFIVDPDRKGATPSKPTMRETTSQQAYYARKYMERLLIPMGVQLRSMRSPVG